MEERLDKILNLIAELGNELTEFAGDLGAEIEDRNKKRQQQKEYQKKAELLLCEINDYLLRHERDEFLNGRRPTLEDIKKDVISGHNAFKKDYGIELQEESLNNAAKTFYDWAYSPDARRQGYY